MMRPDAKQKEKQRMEESEDEDEGLHGDEVGLSQAKSRLVSSRLISAVATRYAAQSQWIPWMSCFGQLQVKR